MTKRLQVTFLPGARADITSEYRYSQKHWGNEHARAYFAIMRSRIAQLAEHPWGSKVPGYADEWRRIIMPGHQILYRVDEAAGVVEVFGILGRNRFSDLARIIRVRGR